MAQWQFCARGEGVNIAGAGVVCGDVMPTVPGKQQGSTSAGGLVSGVLSQVDVALWVAVEDYHADVDHFIDQVRFLAWRSQFANRAVDGDAPRVEHAFTDGVRVKLKDVGLNRAKPPLNPLFTCAIAPRQGLFGSNAAFLCPLVTAYRTKDFQRLVSAEQFAFLVNLIVRHLSVVVIILCFILVFVLKKISKPNCALHVLRTPINRTFFSKYFALQDYCQ